MENTENIIRLGAKAIRDVITIKKLVFSASFLLCRLICAAQTVHPEVIFQTGFTTGSECSFSFSPHGRYLLGQNESEYLIWDVSSGKQLKKLKYYEGIMPSMFYLPFFQFSPDEQNLLVPRYPSGAYSVFNLYSQQLTQDFSPEHSDGKFTHARFSADGNRILLLEQQPGSNHGVTFVLYNKAGAKLKTWQVAMPKLFQFSFLVNLVFSKSLKILDKIPSILAFTADDNLDRVYFSLVNGKVYSLNLRDNRDRYFEYDLEQLKNIPPLVAIENLALYKEKLILKSYPATRRVDSILINRTDTLYIADPNQMRVETKKLSTYIGSTRQFRSIAFMTLPIGSNQSLNVLFRSVKTGKTDYETSCFDVLSDRELFKYKKGKVLNTEMGGEYQAGSLNGGYMVGISPDQRMMAECTREIVIHNVSERNIRSVLASARGQMKLGAPLYLDKEHLFIPKLYNDGFIVDLRNAGVTRLSRQIDYADTAHNGIYTYFFYDNTAQMGLENAALTKTKQLLTTDFSPTDAKTGHYQKRLILWDSLRIKKQIYTYDDRELTYHLSALPEISNKYLVNYKLITFNEHSPPDIKELRIIQKKDTFYSAKPIYLPGKKLIVTAMATRSKPGNPGLIFASWDLKGKLIKTYAYKRKKTKLEYQALIYEVQLSPDSTKLLFALHDGTAGIFDLAKMNVTSTYEHGSLLREDVSKLYLHNSITAACFIDNEHFVTTGDNYKISLWTIGKSIPDKTINKDPLFMYSLSLSPDGRYLAGVDIDKTVHLVNIQTGQTDLNFVAYNADAYTMINREGYYTSNKRSNTEVSFLFKGKPYEFSQFDLYLNRPDKVVASLGYANQSEIDELNNLWQKRLTNLSYKNLYLNDAADYLAPDCQLKGLPAVTETHKNQVRFNVVARDKFYPINSLHVNVNGVPLYGARGLPVNMLKPGTTTLPVIVSLGTGLNRVVVSVRNKQGVESLQQSFKISYSGEIRKPNLYLIAIGSGKFLQAKKDLKYAAKDARDIVRLFSRSKNFNRVIVDTLMDNLVSRQNLIKLRSRLKLSRPDDQVVIYYTGHGQFDDKNRYYLSTYLNDFDHPAAKGISYDVLESLMDGIPAQNRLLMIDACYSGKPDKDIIQARPTANSDKQEELFMKMRSMFSDTGPGNGANIFTASGSYESAYEFDSLHNGVFVYFLKKGVSSGDADLNKDGKITVSELGEYLNREVYAYTEKSQQPTIRNENIVKDAAIF